MFDARPVALKSPFENALGRQFVILTKENQLLGPLPGSFAGPKWLEMPAAHAQKFFKICQHDSGQNTAVLLGCSTTGSVCVIKFRIDLNEGMLCWLLSKQELTVSFFFFLFS
jgi:hypothetical protein